MTAPSPTLDLDDVASLEAADSTGALRSAAMGGAQVRATAAAVSEAALIRLADLRPRSALLVTGPGRASRAASLVVKTLGGRAGLPLLHLGSTPPWVGPLDVVVVAGDDAGDPRLVESVDLALRRGAEVVIVAPDEGPLRAAGAGRASALPPRVRVLDHNAFARYLAAFIAVLAAVDSARSGPFIPDLESLADALDAEATRDHPANEVFHNPAKALASRMQNREIVFTGDTDPSAELAAHASEILLRCAGIVSSATDLADTLAAAHHLAGAGHTARAGDYDPFFHDEQLDGPPPRDKVRIFVLSADSDRAQAERRIAALTDADLVTVDAAEGDQGELPRIDPSMQPAQLRTGRELEELAVLAVRLEMAAAYLQLVASRGVERSAGERV